MGNNQRTKRIFRNRHEISPRSEYWVETSRYLVDVDRGITTNANEIFYLPSKFWIYRDETETFLTLKGANPSVLKLSKNYLKPLVRLPHIKASPYTIAKLTKKKHEEYVLWVEDASKVQDHGVWNI